LHSFLATAALFQPGKKSGKMMGASDNERRRTNQFAPNYPNGLANSNQVN
jgi:hypothetical protein